MKYIEKRGQANVEKEKISYKSMIFIRNLLLDHNCKDLQELFNVRFKFQIKEFFQLYSQTNFEHIFDRMEIVLVDFYTLKRAHCTSMHENVNFENWGLGLSYEYESILAVPLQYTAMDMCGVSNSLTDNAA